MPRGRLLGLRGDERKLAEALEQIHDGVPLNWGQIEDDDALATLQYLSPLADDYVAQTGHAAPEGLRRAVLADLDARLPQPKPPPVKEVPKTMAGFSERVQVLTQVEEDVPSLQAVATWWVGASTLAAAVIALLIWGLSLLLPAPPQGPVYRWVELRQGNTPISDAEGRGSWALPVCQGYEMTDPTVRRTYVSIPDPAFAQEAVGFPILYFPHEVAPSEGVTHTMRVVGRGVSPCEGTEPSATDAGTSVRTEYLAYTRGNVGRGRTITRVKLFQSNRVPAPLDVASGKWEEVEVEGGRGVFWEGDRYRDAEGEMWRDGARVLVLERGDAALTVVTPAEGRIGREELLQLAAGLSQDRAPELGRRAPTLRAGGRCAPRL